MIDINNTVDFFPRLLGLIAEAFNSGDTCILEVEDLECKDESKKIIKVLASVRVNEFTSNIEFIPIAVLFDANPMANLKMVNGGAVLASQKPMKDWIVKANANQPDKSNLN